MATYQTVWPCFPLTFPRELYLGGAVYHRANGYPGIAVQPSSVPVLHAPPSQELRRKNYRMFFLDSSVFDLVDAHKYLSLTDQRLLGWYLSLDSGDRKIILDEGGFQQYLERHPALEVSKHHVYVKGACGIGRLSPAQPLITSNQQISKTAGAIKESRDLGLEMHQRDVREASTPQSHELICPCHLLGHQAYNVPVTQAPGHQRAHRERVAPQTRLSEDWLQWQPSSSSSSSSSSSASAVGMDQSVLSTISLDMQLQRRRQRGATPELSGHISVVQDYSAHLTANGAEVAFLPSLENVDAGEYGDGGIVQLEEPEQVSCSPGPAHESSSSVMKDDVSVLVCRASDGPDSFNSDVRGSSEKRNVPTRDIMVGSELIPCVSASTQSEPLPTADKNMVTEVHMSDLDYLTREFMKLSAAQKEQRGKMKSVDPTSPGGCDCVKRAEQAELRLLAAHYLMCRQHCRSKEAPANSPGVVQKLERDYELMREKMLEGVPLDKLRPLCVDSGNVLTTGAGYIPAHIIGDVLGNLPSGEPEKNQSEDERNKCPGGPGRDGAQTREEKLKEQNNNRTCRVICSVPQDKNPKRCVSKPEEQQTQLHVSEWWYDAEENLEPGAAGGLSDAGEESVRDETGSSALCVSDLPCDASESDVMKLFEKYQASEVILSVLKNDRRVAIVTVSGPQRAEAAVRELNGFGVNGRTLRVEHINDRAVGGAQASGSSHCESTQESTRPGPTEADLRDRDRPLPLSPSRKSRAGVCIPPTGRPTYVSQHLGTLGSLDALMAELRLQHPGVARRRIADALMELSAKHQGVLGSLPLWKIRELTSELLTQAEDFP